MSRYSVVIKLCSLNETGVGSTPARFTENTISTKEFAGSHLMRIAYLEKLKALSLDSTEARN